MLKKKDILFINTKGGEPNENNKSQSQRAEKEISESDG
jgi:hypothetical protein